MKPKGLLVAVVLLAALGGAIWYSNKKQAQKEKAPADASPKIVSIPEDRFREIRLQKAGAEPIVLSHDSGKWALTAPQPLPADPDASASLVGALASVSADKTIDDNATDLASYGLASPALQAQVVEKDGKQVQLRSEEHTSELQSPRHLVCRLLIEKKKTSMQTVRASERMAAKTLMGPARLSW